MGNRTKKRSPALAAMLTLFGAGVGFLYVGKIWYALGLSVLPVIALSLVAWTGLIFVAPGFYVLLLGLAVLLLGAPILAAVCAKRAGIVTLRPYQRWYVYVVWYVVFGAATSTVLGNRAEWLGYETFRFPSSSMRDTMLPGDFFISNSWKYRTRAPERGELIVFRFPGDPSIKYVKRVIGLPGDTVEIKQGIVHVNGDVLPEPYVRPENSMRTMQSDLRFTVPAESFFVLGDNRDRSNDSRYWGFVPKDYLHGSAEYVWFSWEANTGIRLDRLAMRLE